MPKTIPTFPSCNAATSLKPLPPLRSCDQGRSAISSSPVPRHDVAIIGSGFSGSILAWILSSQGADVVIIDGQTHPRFAIGESSTPGADLLLRQIGQQYQLQPLVDLSTYGGWKRTHPRITCGKKRGFSYFHHRDLEAFNESCSGDHSLLVAASRSDDTADTHWYRSEVDKYFFDQAILSGSTPHSATTVVDIAAVGHRYRLQCQGNYTGQLIADHIIDASGRAAVTANLLGKPSLRKTLKTQTSVTYGHFRNVKPWTQYLQNQGLDTSLDPFDADDAAQHHLGPFDLSDADQHDDGQAIGGWTWMLRFDNDITSVGFCSLRSQKNVFSKTEPYRWMMDRAVQVHPPSGESLLQVDYLQTYFDPIVAPRIWMMPTAAITLDPLHSTGIAHAMVGIQRLAAMVLRPNDSSSSSSRESTGGFGDDSLGDSLTPSAYADTLHQEVALLDELTSTAYSVMDDPDRWGAACMVYFAGAIGCEEKMQSGQHPTHLYGADDAAFLRAARQACKAIRNRENQDFLAVVRDQIAPWNTVGLMDPAVNNRYAYSATKR